MTEWYSLSNRHDFEFNTEEVNEQQSVQLMKREVKE